MSQPVAPLIDNVTCKSSGKAACSTGAPISEQFQASP